MSDKLSKDELVELWRNCEAVCFDVDSTVCVGEAIDEFAAFLGVGEQVASLCVEMVILSFFIEMKNKNINFNFLVLFCTIQYKKPFTSPKWSSELQETCQYVIMATVIFDMRWIV